VLSRLWFLKYPQNYYKKKKGLKKARKYASLCMSYNHLGGRRGCMVAGFITTYAISAYHH